MLERKGRFQLYAPALSQPLPSGIARARGSIANREQLVNAFSRSRIAAAVSLAISATVQAQSPPVEPKTMSKISVEAAEPVETPKVDRVESPKFTQPLLDTPQTIAVVSSAVLKQQGAT